MNSVAGIKTVLSWIFPLLQYSGTDLFRFFIITRHRQVHQGAACRLVPYRHLCWLSDTKSTASARFHTILFANWTYSYLSVIVTSSSGDDANLLGHEHRRRPPLYRTNLQCSWFQLLPIFFFESLFPSSMRTVHLPGQIGWHSLAAAATWRMQQRPPLI